MKLAEVETAAGAARLQVLGGFRPEPDEGLGKALLLLGPGPDFWHHFAQSPEMRDGQPDPVDRWSTRVLTRLGEVVGTRALFPFGGEPYHPFFTWATRTGRIWPSPVQLLVHADQGLWVSFRGALAFDEDIRLPEPAARPCDSCTGKPCLSACPVGALGGDGYDVPACKDYLAGDPDCMNGCHVRAACPVSRDSPRDPRQSAYHMRAFR